jgi:hypothetical protein
MVRTFKEVTTPAVPETTKTVAGGVACDLCGREGKGTTEYGGGFEWGYRYEHELVTVSFKTGASYPEGGSGEKMRFDICPDCFKKKLVPWFAEQGVEPHVDEWDC